MNRLLMVVTIAALVLAGAPVAAQVLFQDDFEAGLGNWVVYPGASGVDWSSVHNIVPVGGSRSAYVNSSLDRIYHNLGVESGRCVRGTWYIYDSSQTRAFGELRSHPGNGYGTGSADQVIAAGKYNQTGYNPAKYQGRVTYPGTLFPTTGGWFNLDAPRSPGWHRFDVECTSAGSVRFYVDGVLSGTVMGATVKTMDSVFLGLGLGSTVGDAWYDGVRVENPRDVLALNAQGLDAPTNTLYVRFGQPVMIKMDVSSLAQKVNACQAMLGYSNYYLFAEAGCVAPGGGYWDQLIYNSWDVGSGEPGEVDTAIGMEAYGYAGTDLDSTVASILLTARDKEGETYVIFRHDVSDTESTIFSDLAANPVYPFKVDSQRIVIDGTAPACNITHATQNSIELLQSLGSTAVAVQGGVNIIVAASDALSGFPLAPSVQVRIAGQNVPVAFVNQSPTGFYNYTATISSTTPNGVATIIATATDRAGNFTTDTDTFVINKNQITGQVELQSFLGSSRAVTFVATGGTTKSWTPTLSFSGGVASYVLTDVPDGTVGLSAKTAWSLRNKLPVALDGNNQAIVNFTGAESVRGGDLNGSNSVNVMDYSIMKTSWGSGTVGDINGDGFTGTLDYSVMKSNWFQLGDAE